MEAARNVFLGMLLLSMVVTVLHTRQLGDLEHVDKRAAGFQPLAKWYKGLLRARPRRHQRYRRWDFTTEGCHCSGFNVQCLKDSYCKFVHRSLNWSCVKTCCGFKCVNKPG